MTARTHGTLRCNHCGMSFPRSEKWVHIVRKRGDIDIKRGDIEGIAKATQSLWLCGDCHPAFLSWLGIEPDTPGLWAEDPRALIPS